MFKGVRNLEEEGQKCSRVSGTLRKRVTSVQGCQGVS